MLNKLLTLILAVVLVPAAQADGRTAAHNLFSNLGRSRASLSVNEATALVAPTLVRGMYSISNPQGHFIGFTNELGTLFGDLRGLSVVPTNGGPVRRVGLDEIGDLRQEVVDAIDYDKLVRLSYGDGGGRRILVFSALDCPLCRAFEESMRRMGGEANTTFFVVPSSLMSSAQGGRPTWDAAARIWCAEDAGASWRAYWATRTVPQPRQCRFDGRTAELAAQQLREILQAVGISVSGTPQFVREDGQLVRNNPAMDAAYLANTFGAAGAPQVAQHQARWLTAVVDTSFQPQPIGTGQAAPQQQNHPASHKSGLSALKGLLGSR